VRAGGAAEQSERSDEFCVVRPAPLVSGKLTIKYLINSSYLLK
jgi:hypothetical protein